jgi:hypothetical protein
MTTFLLSFLSTTSSILTVAVGVLLGLSLFSWTGGRLR